jgi:hypothetical protein
VVRNGVAIEFAADVSLSALARIILPFLRPVGRPDRKQPIALLVGILLNLLDSHPIAMAALFSNQAP